MVVGVSILVPGSAFAVIVEVITDLIDFDAVEEASMALFVFR